MDGQGKIINTATKKRSVSEAGIISAVLPLLVIIPLFVITSEILIPFHQNLILTIIAFPLGLATFMILAFNPLGFALPIVGTMEAIKGIFEKNSTKLVPILGLILNIIATYYLMHVLKSMGCTLGGGCLL